MLTCVQSKCANQRDRTCTRTLAISTDTRDRADTVDSAAHITDPNRFPFNNFKHFLTLFSKFFSSFPHGTCSLSVSRRYLALEEVYLPLRAAFPSNPTRRKPGVKGRVAVMDGVLTLYDAPFLGDLYGARPNQSSFRLQFDPRGGQI